MCSQTCMMVEKRVPDVKGKAISTFLLQHWHTLMYAWPLFDEKGEKLVHMASKKKSGPIVHMTSTRSGELRKPYKVAAELNKRSVKASKPIKGPDGITFEGECVAPLLPI